MKAEYRNNAFIRFIINAGLLYLLVYLVYQFMVRKYTYYDQAFIGRIIQAVELVLKALGYKTFTVLQDLDVQVVGIDGSSGVWVGSNCNAITLFALFSVFVIAYPGRQKHKWWFLPLGIVSIHVLNILRVTALAIIANHAPAWLDFNHTYTFTFIVYAYIFLLWMLWANRFAANTQRNEQKAA